MRVQRVERCQRGASAVHAGSACQCSEIKLVAPLDEPDDELMLHIDCGYLLAEHRELQCFDFAQPLVHLSRDHCEALLGED